MKQVINNMVLANNLDIVVWIVLTKIYPSMLNYLRFQLTTRLWLKDHTMQCNIPQPTTITILPILM